MNKLRDLIERARQKPVLGLLVLRWIVTAGERRSAYAIVAAKRDARTALRGERYL
jgi:hypothetical protein